MEIYTDIKYRNIRIWNWEIKQLYLQATVPGIHCHVQLVLRDRNQTSAAVAAAAAAAVAAAAAAAADDAHASTDNQS